MFWGDGKNLDLGSKPGQNRDVSVKARTVRSVNAPAHRPTVHTGPKSVLRNLPSTISSAEGDVEVLARFSSWGVVQVIFAAALSLFLLGVWLTWIVEGSGFVAMIALVIGGMVLVGVWSSAIAGLNSLLRRQGRAVWISGDKLLAIDPFHGVVIANFREFEKVRYDPKLKSGKSYRAAIVLTRQGGRQKAFGVGHLDAPHDEIVKRIYEAKHRPG